MNTTSRGTSKVAFFPGATLVHLFHSGVLSLVSTVVFVLFAVLVSVSSGHSQSVAFSRADFAAGNNPDSIATADFNGDDKLDLVVANMFSGTISVLFGNGDGTFQQPLSFPAGTLYPGAITVADLNEDSKLDLVVTNSKALSFQYSSPISVLLGNGDGTFQQPRNFTASNHPIKAAVADFNGDSKLDLAAANYYSNDVSLLLGNGDGTFQPAVNYDLLVGFNGVNTPAPADIIVGDFNGDGKLDFVTANFGSSQVSVLLGNSNGTFQAPMNFNTYKSNISDGNSPLSVSVADFDGDGKPDVVVANANSDNVSVLLGNGDGTLQPAVHFAVGRTPYSVAASDINGDGSVDLVVANATGSGVSGTISVLLGNGDGTFQTAVNFPAGITASYLAVADFNGDNKFDIAVANVANNFAVTTGTVSVLTNNSIASGDSTPPITNAAGSPSPNANGWNNTNVTIILDATDNPGGSGVKQIEFVLRGAENTGWQTVMGNTASLTISTEGTTILTYFATDNEGNQESAKRRTVRIDKTPPAISGFPAPGCTIWPPNHKLVKVATVVAGDVLSGIPPGSFAVTGNSNDPTNGKIVITGGPSQFNIQLGADKGQVYTLTATASDLAGNTAKATVTCTVPHDQGK
jgi:hypothetical protein